MDYNVEMCYILTYIPIVKYTKNKFTQKYSGKSQHNFKTMYV